MMMFCYPVGGGGAVTECSYTRDLTVFWSLEQANADTTDWH